MRKFYPILVVVLMVNILGCYRTVYTNLSPMASPPQATVPKEPEPRWQHFFIFGWFPSERTIDARQACGGTHLIEEVRTRQTFLQGLVKQLTSYYVNVYSPWNGEVICK